MTRILVLDDHAEIVTIIARILTCAGYECCGTVDGNQAWEILNRQRIDLIVQDCLREKPNGFEFYELLKADPNLRDVPVLFFSAGVLPEDTAAMRSAYGDEHVRKPASAQELLTPIMTMLERSGIPVPSADDRRARFQQMRANLQNESGIDWEKQFAEIDEWLTQQEVRPDFSVFGGMG